MKEIDYKKLVKDNAFKGPMSFQEIANEMKISKQRVQQIYSYAIKKLRYFIAKKRLQDPYAFETEVDNYYQD